MKVFQKHRDTSRSYHELLLGPRAKSGTEFGYELCLHALSEGPELRYLLEDENSEGLLQKTHRYRRAQSGKFGDLITAAHKFLSGGSESRNNHRYAVVVQDLATQWIQSYPCKTKTSQETQRSLQKFLEPNRKPKVIYTDNSLEFGKACEE